jgi:DNA-binding Xre family transcriptional regulator
MRRLSINWKFVEQRRIAVGLSRAQLADRIGAAGESWPVQLWRDGDYDDIPLGVLEELCHVLDLQPADLFIPPPRVADGARAPSPVGTDDAIVEAALAGLVEVNPPAISRARLANALGWSLDRLEIALGRMEIRLETGGVRFDRDVVNRAEPLQGLRPRHGLLTEMQRYALHQLRVADDGLAEPVLQALYQIIIVGYEYTEATLDHSAETAIELQRQGLVRRRPSGGVLDPTDDVRFSLLLDPAASTDIAPAATDTTPAQSTENATTATPTCDRGSGTESRST